jgi:hypothetical protein
MQASHNLARVSVTFDDDPLLPNGGLSVAALLAQKLGAAERADSEFAQIADETRVGGPSWPPTK